MPSDNIKSRVLRAVRESLLTLPIPDFGEANVLRRKREILADIPGKRGIVICQGNVDRQRSPAGLRNRRIECLVSIVFKMDGTGSPDAEDQESIVEEIAAAFDLPPAMPEPLTEIVPEAEECRVTEREMFVSTLFPYKADLHRLRVSVEVCQVAGVAT